AAKKPLLPLAGSNKAYDPATGEWRMQESFPLAPEALLPRRISQVPCGAVTLERVLPFGYKAAALCVDETVLAPGQELAVPLPELPAEARYAPELAVYLRCEEGASCLTRIGGSEREIQSEQVLLAGRTAECTLLARGGRCYVLAVHAG